VDPVAFAGIIYIIQPCWSLQMRRIIALHFAWVMDADCHSIRRRLTFGKLVACMGGEFI
jgi:hypothetical protein